MEVLSLGDSLECQDIADLPSPTQELIAVVDSQGRPLACGGRKTYPEECLAYDIDTNLWTAAPSMSFPRNFGTDAIRLSDGRYWISGDDSAPGYFDF